MVAISPPPPPTEDDAPPAYDADPAGQQDELGITLVAQASSQELLVSLVPPTQPHPAGEKVTGKRAPLDLCLVIDVSGSMDSEAPVPGEQNKNETTGLSVLDVVKHATRTIIESMSDDDRIAIVTFSDSAEVIAPLTSMTKENRAEVWGEVEGLRTRGMTNLWDGLKTGINVVTGAGSAPAAPAGPSSQRNTQSSLPSGFRGAPTPPKRSSLLGSIGLGQKRQAPISDEPKSSSSFKTDIKALISPTTATQLEDSSQRLPAVFILTDGQPNIEPPRGHIPMLRSYLDALPSSSPKLTISTFGFGYNLDSGLLDEIADLGQGMYGFIPDSGMVGTVFVHAVANLMATWATGCVLDIEVIMKDPTAQAKVEVLGALSVRPSSWGASILVGDLQYGQSRDIVVKLPPQCFGIDANHTVNITARYSPHTLVAGAPLPQIMRTLDSSHEINNSVVLQHEVYRLSFVSAVYKLFQKLKRSRNTNPPSSGPEFEQSLTNYISNPMLKEYEPSTALTSDIMSQVILGLEPAHWSRWGMHYIPSLARSHQRQQCSNFKDAGLQVYGCNSGIFTSIRDSIDQTFDSLPPPKPSLKDRAVYRPGNSAPAAYAPVTSMSMYRSRAAPCFAGWCLVDTGNGQSVKVSDLCRGSIVRTPNGTARVAAILRTICPGGFIELCTVDQLVITPWHPMKHGGSWVFPAEVCQPESKPCDYVYSILLEPSADTETHALCIEGIWCVTLGHGCTDSVRAHTFLGNYARVVESLSQMNGYYDNTGVIDGAGIVRDETTGLVCGFKQLSVGKNSLACESYIYSQCVACEA